ncbi:MAG TPA: DNA mismatch repair protein MutS [Patescibacteria group bacterium]
MENTAFSTPMMKQYLDIKSKYKDCLLLYRMGDFYELFMDDAFVGAQILNITLTHKRGGKDGKIPMAGIPYHAVDSYLHKLVKSGYKVAICEQLSPPNKRGLVERDVIRVVTPGTLLDEKALDKKANNYIISLDYKDNIIALSIADLSTGYFATTQTETSNIDIFLKNELSRLTPSECILPEELYNNLSLLKIIKEQVANIYAFKQWSEYAESAESLLKKHFAVNTLAAFNVLDKKVALQTSAALLGYLQITQKAPIQHIKKIELLEQENAVLLDKSTMINLELFSTIREHNTRGSLLSVLDETITAMGGRLLKQWLKKPLLSKKDILMRHDAVEYLVKHTNKRDNLRKTLEEITDIERILSRLSVNIGNARDLVNLKNSLKVMLHIKADLKLIDIALFSLIRKDLSKDLEKVIDIITTAIVDEPPIDTKSGNMIKKGINKTLDELQFTITHSKEWIADFEVKERKRSGINSLKVKFNQVFGFYIEVSKPNLHLVPKDYQRKQTLVNGERFMTPELKKHEEIILTAEEKVNELEFELFTQILNKVLVFTQSLQQAANTIATLDCIGNFAHISQKYNYTRPTLLYSGEIKITQGRHPVVENLLDTDSPFVPNDVTLDNINQSLALITGPNMAGKSVFIRQVAVIALMNQLGCFVPAKKAYLSLVDKIFVRSGASDVITSGLSTFMVEMVETAHILHNATSKSLIVMDEIGRGTSTYDGISIAWAVASYLATHFKPAPKTLFATHYHELQALENEFPKAIKNYHMAVGGTAADPVFLHALTKGGASHSFGVAVAKLAGVPQEVIDNATSMLHVLERRSTETKEIKSEPKQTTIEPLPTQQSIATHLLQKELENVDIANMTPLEAMNKLAELKDQLKLLTDTSTKVFLEAD